MVLIEQANKLFIIVEKVADRRSKGPVDIDLIGVLVDVGVVFVCSCFGPFLSSATRHDEDRPQILPLQPNGEQAFAVVDPIGDVLVDV